MVWSSEKGALMLRPWRIAPLVAVESDAYNEE